MRDCARGERAHHSLSMDAISAHAPDAARHATTEREWKFVLDAGRAQTFLSAIERWTAPILHGAPLSFTRTTYLDTDDLAWFRKPAGGVERRLRVRQYARAFGENDAPRLDAGCCLELKESSGSERRKLRFFADARVIDAGGSLRPEIDGGGACETQLA